MNHDQLQMLPDQRYLLGRDGISIAAQFKKTLEPKTEVPALHDHSLRKRRMTSISFIYRRIYPVDLAFLASRFLGPSQRELRKLHHYIERS